MNENEINLTAQEWTHPTTGAVRIYINFIGTFTEKLDKIFGYRITYYKSGNVSSVDKSPTGAMSNYAFNKLNFGKVWVEGGEIKVPYGCELPSAEAQVAIMKAVEALQAAKKAEPQKAVEPKKKAVKDFSAYEHMTKAEIDLKIEMMEDCGDPAEAARLDQWAYGYRGKFSRKR